jgi:hypothetical protein
VGGGLSLAGFSVQVKHSLHIADQVATVWAYLLTIAVVLAQCSGMDAAEGLNWGKLGLAETVENAKAEVAAKAMANTAGTTFLSAVQKLGG